MPVEFIVRLNFYQPQKKKMLTKNNEEDCLKQFYFLIQVITCFII